MLSRGPKKCLPHAGFTKGECLGSKAGVRPLGFKGIWGGAMVGAGLQQHWTQNLLLCVCSGPRSPGALDLSPSALLRAQPGAAATEKRLHQISRNHPERPPSWPPPGLGRDGLSQVRTPSPPHTLPSRTYLCGPAARSSSSGAPRSPLSLGGGFFLLVLGGFSAHNTGPSWGFLHPLPSSLCMLSPNPAAAAAELG